MRKVDTIDSIFTLREELQNRLTLADYIVRWKVASETSWEVAPITDSIDGIEDNIMIWKD